MRRMFGLRVPQPPILRNLSPHKKGDNHYTLPLVRKQGGRLIDAYHLGYDNRYLPTSDVNNLKSRILFCIFTHD